MTSGGLISVSSKKAVGDFFGKTRRTVINWSKRWSRDCEVEQGYNLQTIEAWALSSGLIPAKVIEPSDPEQENNAGDPQDRAFYEREIKRLDSELKSIKLQKERGDLVPRDEIAREWAQRIGEVSNALDYLANRLPPLLDGLTPREMMKVITEQTWDIRDRFTRTGRFCPVIEN